MRILNTILLSILLVLITSFVRNSFAQKGRESKACREVAGNGYFGPTVEIIELDYLSNIAKTTIPFDRWFYIKKIVRSSEVVSAVAIKYANGDPIYIHQQDRDYTNACFEQKPAKDNEGFDEVTILVPPIKPNSSFELVISYFLNDEALSTYFDLFTSIKESDNTQADKIISKITSKRKPTLVDFKYFYDTYKLEGFFNKYANASPSVQNYLKEEFAKIINTQTIEVPVSGKFMSDEEKDDRRKRLKDSGRAITEENINKQEIRFRAIEVTGLEQQTFSLETRSKYILLPDVGYTYYGFNDKFRGATPYAGIAVNFRSYDPDIPLKLIRNNFINRLSFHLGVTFGSVAKDLQRENLLGTRTLITGLGYSFSHALRLNGGLLIYNKLDNNPLIDSRTINAVPYIGLSLDLKIKELAKDAAEIFSGGLLPKVR